MLNYFCQGFLISLVFVCVVYYAKGLKDKEDYVLTNNRTTSITVNEFMKNNKIGE